MEFVGTDEATDNAHESETAQQHDIGAKVFRALNCSFFVVNYIDLVQYRYVNLWAQDYVGQLIAGCDTIDKGFDAFISILVKPDFTQKVRDFCCMDTIAERLQGNNRIDCEYISTFAKGWCRASFYPTEWDEDGTLTHVLFTVSPVDKYIAAEKEESVADRENLATIFDEVPGGIVLYRWDGSLLKVLRMSKYYRDLYGCSMLGDNDSPDYLRIHPEDLPGYQKAIAEALEKTHSLAYAFRVWNQPAGRYSWMQVDAISKPQEDGTSLVYAMYADISAQKEAELALEKRALDQQRGYKRQIQRLFVQNSNALCAGAVNLSKNSFSNVRAHHIIKCCADASTSFDELIRSSARGVFVKEEREAYLKLLNCEELLRRFATGETRISIEHFFRVDATHTEWVETALDLTENPITGDVVGICSARSLNRQKMSRILLKSSLKSDYLAAALVYMDTGEYYRYEDASGDYCCHQQHYFETLARRVARLSQDEDLETILQNLSRDVVCAHLDQDGAYAYAFYGNIGGHRCRFEASYAWVNKEHSLALANLRDITDSALYDRYHYESEHDPLSGLLNRETLFRRTRQLLERNPKTQFVLVHGDIRHFRLYNTFYGEDAGNELLRAVAGKIASVGDSYDMCESGRIESDVFCAILPFDERLFEEQTRSFLDWLAAYREDFPLQAAIGLYKVTDPSLPVEAMFARAGIAAKAGKKNLFGLVSCFDEGMEHDLEDSQAVAGEMAAALAEEQFQVYLQPKYSLRSEKIVGAEALVRWQHPRRGMISPGRFIPTLEKNGFIADLDRYMWERACRVLRGWMDAGKPMFPVSVNISRVSMYSRATVPYVESLVEKYGIEPRYLELELTESAYMDDPEDLKRMLRELQDYGFTILMDDFGSGYSSLNMLRELPVDILKLDMKFLSDSQQDERAAAVLSSVVRMSKLLHLPIVAEGVERREQADYLREIGCEYVQGFLFSRPVPLADFEELVARQEAGPFEDNEMEKELTAGELARACNVDSIVSVGMLEYEAGRFAYLHANENFIEEFGLVEDLAPASEVFRRNLDDENYAILMQTFAQCARSRGEAMLFLKWNLQDGLARTYQGHVKYTGRIGGYDGLTVVFVNITDMPFFGFDKSAGPLGLVCD